MTKKIAIWDGCAHGGMMDSLSIHPYEEDDGVPTWVADVSEEDWTAWELFLKEHGKWDVFWDKQMTSANRHRNKK